MSRVSRAMRRALAVGSTPRVRMLCRRSASLTRMTRISRAMARAIFWKFSACFSSSVSNSICVSLLTAVHELGDGFAELGRSRLVMPVSSMTSCSMAAIRLWWSMCMSARMPATARGWVT
jgi:hypothetical protein